MFRADIPWEASPEGRRGLSRGYAGGRAGRAFQQREQNVQSVTREADEERAQVHEKHRGGQWLKPARPLATGRFWSSENREAGKRVSPGVEITDFTASGYWQTCSLTPALTSGKLQS